MADVLILGCLDQRRYGCSWRYSSIRALTIAAGGGEAWTAVLRRKEPLLP